MPVEQVLYDLLLHSAAVSAVCADRIEPNTLDVDTPLPAISYSVISGTQWGTNDNQGVQKWRVQLDCWGESYSDAVSLRSAVISTLSGYSGPGTSIMYQNSIDFFDYQLEQFRAMVEFYVLTSGFGVAPALASPPPPAIGAPSNISDFTYAQTLPSAIWVINHGLGRYVSVTTFDSAGNTVVGQVHYDSPNQVTITFSAAFSGSAYLV